MNRVKVFWQKSCLAHVLHYQTRVYNKGKCKLCMEEKCYQFPCKHNCNRCTIMIIIFLENNNNSYQD